MMVYPDLRWYTKISSERRLTPRCPYATTNRCPRYYQSISLLGESSVAAKIAKDEDHRLLSHWSKTDVWPKTKEEATSVSGPSNEAKYFANFCPEVSFEVFGLFAYSLSRYADEIDRDITHKALIRAGTSHGNDWRWSWAHVSPRHYSECPLYSLLSTTQSRAKDKSEILTLRPGMFGVSVDVKAMFKKLRQQWCARG